MVKLFGEHAYFWILCWTAIMVVWILWDIKKTLEDISGDLGRVLADMRISPGGPGKGFD